MIFFAKDFVETADELMFAVVADGIEQGKVLCFLRYIKGSVGWEKLSTAQANAFLERHHPHYLHYSPLLDAHLHAVAVSQILKHHPPKNRLQQIMRQQPLDAVERDVWQLGQLLQQHGLDLTHIGITGSILIGVQQHSSDIDLVCYRRDVFQQCRELTRQLVAQDQLQALNDNDWLASYQRRSCALSFADYVWHEQRKYNKAIVNGRKFDLNFIDATLPAESIHYQKAGAITVQCRVIDDSRAFDYPAEFKLDHPLFATVVSFTATYTGQALTGEWVEISAFVEQTQAGVKRLVVGSSREADGEYIKVIRA
jgi:predicted nucleotidyltransferase